MEFIIISGMSGAGKSQSVDTLEDLNYYCVDNMPVSLIPRFAELCVSMPQGYDRVVLVTDVREMYFSPEALFNALDELVKLQCTYKILFVEANKATIVKRYKETRRRHPVADENMTIEDAVEHEMELLAPIRARADLILDTSSLTIGMLQAELYNLFVGEGQPRILRVNVISFGFKHGLPLEADLVFDVRFLPNPYYVPELRELSGMNDEVYTFVHGNDVTVELMTHLRQLLTFLLPHYVEEGKHSLTIAVGCTGGRHRSISVARALREFLSELGHETLLVNRDLDK